MIGQVERPSKKGEGMTQYTRRNSLALGLGMLAAACGGGGSGGSPTLYDREAVPSA